MKKFHFSLKELLALRAFKERQAEMVLAEKSGKVRLIELELQRIAAERHKTAQMRFSGSRNILDYLADERYLARLEMEKERRLKELAEAELEREKALESYHEASKQKKVLDKMEENELAAYRKAADRREILIVDDITTGARMREALRSPANA
jgi:flagellar export protein FliJ